MKRTILGLLLCTAFSAFAQPTIAVGEPAPGLTIELPPVLQAAKAVGTLTILKDFKAAGGMQGWAVRESTTGENAIIYTTPDGEGLIAGMLVDKTGRNLTALYATEHLPKPVPPDYTEAFTAYSSAAAAVVGSPKAKAEITVLFDANCGYCKLMHRLLKPTIAAGELRVRYVPVAILGADSGTKGAGLLAAKNPGLLVDSLSSGGNAEFSSDKALLAKVQANTGMMKKYGFKGTPAVLYKVKQGDNETVMVSNGLPNMLALFTALGINGQLETLKADPALAKYAK